jgi:eukaryotic-like serine/threonine-protein kinase
VTPRHGSLIGGRYSLEQSIGSGGMGEVFRASDTLLGRAVAIKLVHAVDPRKHKQVSESFLREARISAAIAHPSVVQILDFGIHEGDVPFIVMELLEGENLADMLGRGVCMPIQVIFDLLLRVLDALRAAHAAGVIHRDIKPENIFLTRERGGVSPKLLDFGISKVLDKTGVARVTTTHGQIVGTPAYMSPEQARGLKEIDQRTDVYSMGVVLYELLSGELPFVSENPGDLLVLIMTADAPDLAERIPELAGPLSALVARALAKDPEQRFRDAGEMYEALREVQKLKFELAVPATRAERPGRPSTLESLSLVPAPERLELPASALEASALPWRGIARYGLLAALSVAAATLAVQTLSPSKKSEPRFIVVQTDPRANAQQSEERVHTSASPAVRQIEAVANAESAPPLKRTTAPAGPAEALAQSFRAQRASVVRCVNTYPDEVEQSPKLSLRLSLDAQGAVSDAQLSPAQLAGTPLSACIEDAARALRFPKQVGPVVFDVPLTARKGS